MDNIEFKSDEDIIKYMRENPNGINTKYIINKDKIFFRINDKLYLRELFFKNNKWCCDYGIEVDSIEEIIELILSGEILTIKKIEENYLEHLYEKSLSDLYLNDLEYNLFTIFCDLLSKSKNYNKFNLSLEGVGSVINENQDIQYVTNVRVKRLFLWSGMLIYGETPNYLNFVMNILNDDNVVWFLDDDLKENERVLRIATHTILGFVYDDCHKELLVRNVSIPYFNKKWHFFLEPFDSFEKLKNILFT